MKNILKQIHSNQKEFWTKPNVLSTIRGVLFLFLAILVQNYANNYVDITKSTPVGDIILNNLPTVNVGFFIVEGVLVFTLIILCFFLLFPRFIPFALKTIALFVIIRSFFVSLTHLGVSPGQLVLDPNSIGFDIYNFFYGAKTDFFFSGHTGIPFLFAFIFWQKKYLRYFFFLCTFVFGASVLLAHMHYSIDVFAAPFMTYSIFVISKYLFSLDYRLTVREFENS